MRKEEKYKCALCGRESESYDSFRTIYLDRQKKLANGYFKPRLTMEEKYHLPIFESIVCTNRQQCQTRQSSQSNK